MLETRCDEDQEQIIWTSNHGFSSMKSADGDRDRRMKLSQIENLHAVLAA